ncbi:peptidylprolyl isomerase [Oceanobacter kriegii]|uniref:peptidylprolyl isomerase n=1 Tax=Oceanobacter kriegii TaxID=64972 RepID=UPI000481081C|nr:peptidylprolyl isomerase [Oceanobacter kriegii]
MFRRSLLKFFFALACIASLPLTAQAESTVQVRLVTNMGNIELTLYPDQAPVTVANFLTYIEGEHYNNTLFHRVIDNFMIQGGGYNLDMQKKATLPAIKNEADNGLGNERGTIAMARTAAKDSATSQFFINLKNNRFLNHGVRDFGYAVFGKVTSGMDVVDAIGKVDTAARDVPRKPVILEKVEVLHQPT